MKKTAFTLMELTVVLLIIGLVAGIVGVKMGSPISRVKLDDIANKIRVFDGNSRSYAWRQGVTLKVDVDTEKNVIYRLDSDENEVGREFVLPDGFEIDDFRVANGSEDGTREYIMYSTDGLSRSYAIKIADSHHSRWLFFVGLTGQVLEIEDDEKLQEIMESLPRPDAG